MTMKILKVLLLIVLHPQALARKSCPQVVCQGQLVLSRGLHPTWSGQFCATWFVRHSLTLGIDPCAVALPIDLDFVPRPHLRLDNQVTLDRAM